METLPTRSFDRPSDYERDALREIHLWKAPTSNWFDRTMDRVNGVMHQATDLARKVPGVDWTMDTLVPGLLNVTNEITQDSVWIDGIHRDYRAAGHDVESADDIRLLDLEEVDRVLAGLTPKYRNLAAAEGAATGYAGLAGILPDVIALVALNLRAVGEYAVHCGFDLREPSERYYALNILDVVSRPSDTAKEVALAPVIRVSRALAKQQAAQAVEQFALTRAIRNALRSIGVHLTRAKMAQVVPVVGAAVGGGFNAYYTSKVCDAAFFLYRERFLVEKYGPSILPGTA